MTDQPRGKQLYSLHPAPDIEGYDSLAELALDMRTSWDHSADHIWERLDPALWGLTRNPWVVLQTISREKLEQSLADQAFAPTWPTLCATGAARWPRRAGFSRIIRNRH